MWFYKCHQRLIELEKRLKLAEAVNTHQTKILQRNQQYLYLVLAGLCLSLALHFGMQTMEDNDREFVYEFLRFVIGASGLAVAVKAGVMEKACSRSDS